MRYSKLMSALQNLIEREVSIADLERASGIAKKTLYARRDFDRDFSEEELYKISAFYGVDLVGDASCIELDYIHIHPSCGKGTYVIDDAYITPVKIGRDIIKDIWHAEPENLKLFRASGDSMEPVIENDNILLVDISRTDFNNGGIFLLTINNEWFIKRLRLRVTGELDIISENDKYPIETLQPNSNIEIMVKGRVIKNLSRGL